MGVSSGGKLKRLMDAWTPGTVATSVWLGRMGITPQHVQGYVANGWLEPVASGVFKRPRETLSWQGALHSLQTQRDLHVHLGAVTALGSDGSIQYTRLGRETVFLVSKTGVALPAWFKAHDWGVDLRHVQTTFLPPDLGIRDVVMDGFALQSSTPERAILETLHLTPKAVDLVEAYELLEGLRTLRPSQMQSLLEACVSIKVKRVFLFMAAKASLPVLSHLRTDRLDLGTGARALAKGGVYVAEHRLVLPRELVHHG